MKYQNQSLPLFSLHSTMVLLKFARDKNFDEGYNSLHSTMVLLKLIVTIIVIILIVALHSTMVLLKLKIVVPKFKV